MENLAEWINATSITEELNKVESKSYTNEARELLITLEAISCWRKMQRKDQKLVEERHHQLRRVWSIRYQCCQNKRAKEIES